MGDRLFGYKINYTQREGLETPNTDYSLLQVKPRYNGNIAEIIWKTNTNPNDNLRTYGYVYDGLNRLKAGFYQSDVNPSAKEYFEKVDYDLNGNITALKRSASLNGNAFAELIDNISYTYEGNQLVDIWDNTGNSLGLDGGDAIGYDPNGNVIIDRAHFILNIDYNYLNLPIKLEKDNEKIYYFYSSDGRRLSTMHNKIELNEINFTDYLDGFQYKNSVLKFVPTSEGYYNFENNTYIYNYTDHLGNVRLSYFRNANNSAEVLEESNYYPFGMKHEGYNQSTGNPAYNYKYNGKELQETGMYDYGARFYMPDIGRWGVVDPLAEKMTRHSPYNYAFNNPIRYIDPDGMQNEDVIIKGNRSQEALQQLQAATKGQLNLSMDNNGKVIATRIEGSTLSQGASELLAATTDSSITVNVSATDNDFTSDGAGPLLGYFGGNKSSNPSIDGSITGSPGQKTVANQETNADALGNLSKANGVPGQAMLHEVTEAYRGARITQADGNTGVRSTSNNDDSNNSNSVYRRAHDGAVNQGGNINERFYNAQGQEVQRGASNFQPVKLIYTTKNNTVPFHTVPKQR